MHVTLALRLAGEELWLGGCWRSTLAYSGVLGFFVVVPRRRLAAASPSSSITACTATRLTSSRGRRGQLDVVAALSRTLPRPAAPLTELAPCAGTPRRCTWRPRCYTSTPGTSRRSSSAGAATCTAWRTSTAARHPHGPPPRSQWKRLPAPPLNEASCVPAPAWASSQGQEGGRSTGEEMARHGLRNEEPEDADMLVEGSIIGVGAAGCLLPSRFARASTPLAVKGLQDAMVTVYVGVPYFLLVSGSR